ncbi:hypothetical protein ABZ806_01365 [Spirillospora sp. NPDC047418]
MPITDLQTATLHAQLAGHGDEHQRMLGQLTSEEDQDGYSKLLATGFFEAVDQRFVKDGKIAEDSAVVDFVANLRSKTSEVADRLNPSIAERLILHALGRGEIDDIDGNTRLSGQILILGGLIADMSLSEPELDAFMTRIRGMAEDW